VENKINILLPIAGRAQRFIDEGYTMPKPLIMARTKQIIDWAIESINTENCNLIFAIRLDHIHNFSIDDILRQKFGNEIKIVVVDKVTRGSVETCLLAREYIDNELPLVIYTPDVYFQPAFNPHNISKDLDGFLLTFKANSPAHSYVELNDEGYAVRTAEKEVISQNAAVGVYYYKTGKMFVDYADRLIKEDVRVKNEFYICPMFNYLIEDDLKVGIENTQKMHVLGTPAELEFFTNHVTANFGEKPIALCCDHSGFELKESAIDIFKKRGIEYIDFGTHINKDCDYNEYVSQASRAISDKVCDFGIGFCRTGQGINILANHSPGIRSALIFDDYTAEYSIRHNCANFFSVPEKYVSYSILEKIIAALERSSFDGGRHMTRMSKTIKGKSR
jgi:RpiB/LacA/LacB family sugar-phosphate isomerase